MPKGLTHGFGPKTAIFQLFFLGNIGKGNVFYDILERKNAFLGYKKGSSKSGKIDIFPKGLHFSIFPLFEPMAFVQKWPFFELLFLGNIGQENVFYDILKQKKHLPRL